MNPVNTHPLTTHGILASFSIGKSIKTSELKKIEKAMNISRDSPEFQELLRKQIVKETQLAIYNNKIPGLVTNQKTKVVSDTKKAGTKKSSKNKSDVDEAKKKMKLALFATLIIQKVIENDLTTNEQCFLVNRLVGGLGLNSDDFKKFHENSFQGEDTDGESVDD